MIILSVGCTKEQGTQSFTSRLLDIHYSIGGEAGLVCKWRRWMAGGSGGSSSIQAWHLPIAILPLWRWVSLVVAPSCGEVIKSEPWWTTIIKPFFEAIGSISGDGFPSLPLDGWAMMRYLKKIKFFSSLWYKWQSMKIVQQFWLTIAMISRKTDCLKKVRQSAQHFVPSGDFIGTICSLTRYTYEKSLFLFWNYVIRAFIVSCKEEHDWEGELVSWSMNTSFELASWLISQIKVKASFSAVTCQIHDIWARSIESKLIKKGSVQNNFSLKYVFPCFEVLPLK